MEVRVGLRGAPAKREGENRAGSGDGFQARNGFLAAVDRTLTMHGSPFSVCAHARRPLDYSISQPVENATLRVLSLGAGVQSSTLALMAAAGEISPAPDAAIFADTRWEPAAVYAWLDYLEGLVPFPIYRVSGIDMRANVLRAASEEGRFVAMPFYTEAGGIGKRQCTSEAKIKPIRRKVRELCGLAPGERGMGRALVEQWIGISTDELPRLRDSDTPWIKHRWPLIEQRMNRSDCLAWLKRCGVRVTPGRKGEAYVTNSACIGCPYRSDHRWRAMQAEDPAGFADAVAADHALRANGPARGMRALQYMHAARVPLDEVNFGAAGQGEIALSFADECQGLCGL